MENTDNICYKPSFYNYTFNIEKVTILYNTYTGAMAKLLDKDKEQVSAILKDPNANKKSDNGELFETMVNNGYILDKRINELDLVKLRIMEGRFNAKSLAITVLPTMACNCKCTYCFEEPYASTMGKEDIDRIVEFVDEQIKTIKPPQLFVNWYGGEPLLGYAIVEELSLKLMELSKKHGIEYIAHIITNGYLLTRERAERLKELGVIHIQITLDGTEEIHNRRRMLKNGGPTFGKIKEAIIIAKDVFEKVTVRIHIDKETKESAYELLEQKWMMGDNVNVRAGHLKDFSTTCIDWRTDKKSLDGKDYIEVENHFSEVTGTAKYAEENFDYKSYIGLIPLRGRYCSADFMGSWILGPGGKVYRCASALGKNEDCGVISGGTFRPNHNISKWFIDSPIDNEICRNCKLLPLCMGGCPTVRKRYARPEESGICEYWDEFLKRAVSKVVKKLDKI
ncbi:radical SAM protein [candidate division TA06 bacterium]|nr:radical SAM protein [candidate division TA06 bacterium]